MSRFELKNAPRAEVVVDELESLQARYDQAAKNYCRNCLKFKSADKGKFVNVSNGQRHFRCADCISKTKKKLE